MNLCSIKEFLVKRYALSVQRLSPRLTPYALCFTALNLENMKLIYLSFLLILISSTANSQDKYFYIHGKVLDEKTGSVLVNASVFCQNTTMGTISNSEGLFALRLTNGGYDLVISYTGYETQVLRVSNSTKDTLWYR